MVRFGGVGLPSHTLNAPTKGVLNAHLVDDDWLVVDGPGYITSSFGWVQSFLCLLPLSGCPARTCVGTLPHWEPM